MRLFFATVIGIGFVALLPGVAAAQNATPSPRAARTLPPCPPGVTHVAWNEFIKTPVGSLGLELTDKIKTLDGKKVRLLGYMVRRDEPIPGVILLAPYPVSIEEHEGGFADLPPQTVRVSVPYEAKRIVAYSSRPLLLTGTLSVGPKQDAEETEAASTSLFRLTLTMPPVPAPKKTAPKPAKTKPISVPKKARSSP